MDLDGGEPETDVRAEPISKSERHVPAVINYGASLVSSECGDPEGRGGENGRVFLFLYFWLGGGDGGPGSARNGNHPPRCSFINFTGSRSESPAHFPLRASSGATPRVSYGGRHATPAIATGGYVPRDAPKSPAVLSPGKVRGDFYFNVVYGDDR